jgi:hypothetical protein
MPRNVPLKSVPEPREDGPEAKKAATGRGGMGQRKASPPGKFSKETRDLIRARAGWGDPHNARCEFHGDWLGIHGGELQHVVARGMGGSKDWLKNSAANGVLLCRDAHMLAEARDPEMEALGFWAKQGTDPRYAWMMIPLADGTRVKVWRTVDGRYLFDEPEGVAA